MDHRLHDYCQTGKRILEAAGMNPDDFEHQLEQLRRSTGAEIAAGDTFVTKTLELLDSLKKGAPTASRLPGWKSWFPKGVAAVNTGSGRVIVGIKPKHLVATLPRSYTPGERDWLPRNEREATGALLRTTPIFADVGVTVTKREPSVGNAYWEFEFPDV